MNNYDNGYARAQAQYDAQLPPEDDYKECPLCEGSGKIDGNETCPKCDGDGEVAMTGDDLQEKREAAADRAYDAWKDEQMGL